MKPISKTFILALALLPAAGLVPRHAWAATPSHVFDLVPANDATYGQLKQLADDGLLPLDDAKGPLTRFEVAQRIFAIEKNYKKEIVLAQADMELPPPPPDTGTAAGTESSSSTASAAGGEQAAPSSEGPIWNDPQKIEEAEKNLKSLQEAYDFELQLVKDQKADLEDKVSKAEAQQFELWKSVKGITEYPSISIHGLGRAFGISQQYYGNSGVTFLNPSDRFFTDYLDLDITGSVSKEVRWDGVLRMGSFGLPVAGTAAPTLSNPSTSEDYLFFRRMTAEFNPYFMSAKLGDFYEAYTPFTIWNRNNLDLYYMPEMVGRGDDERKYESYFNQEPAWPFRGIEMGTALGWPDSNLLELAKISAFTHMITNSYSDANKWYVGLGSFTGWIFAGQEELKLKKWYTGGTSWQLDLEGYQVILDQPWDSEEPGSPYNPTASNTWAHQYVISSFRPTLKIGLGGDFYIGLQYEGAFSSYQDNKLNPDSITSDYALNMEPFLQMGDSKISFHYLNVGPNFYSPLAQTRQDNYNLLPSYNLGSGYLPGAALFQPPIRNQFFLTTVPRPSAIFSYYDRTQDNTFPYGLSTPNREGEGLELDIETLQQKSLKIRGAAYFVQEIGGNIVVNPGGTGYTVLDPAPNGAAPVRNFTYINFGPSFDLGPNIGLVTPLEIGTNVRYEQTTSIVGTLNGLGIWAGARVGVTKEWELAAAIGAHSASGSEEGINGTTMARSFYVFDSTDDGVYKKFSVNGSDQYLMFSTTLRFDRNSSLYADYDLESGNELPTVGPLPGTLHNQFIGMTYEIAF